MIKAIHLLFSLLLLTIGWEAAAAERLAPPLAEQAKTRHAHTSGAVVLNALEKNVLLSDSLWDRRTYYSIQIIDMDAARDYGRIVISFNHYYGDTELEFANVLAKSGEIKTLAADAIQIRVVGGGQDFYEDRSEITFSLPDVAPGALIEFQFHSRDKKRPIDTVFYDGGSPYWFQRTAAQDSWRADPVLQYRYEMDVPRSLAMVTDIRGPNSTKPKITQLGDRSVTRWTLNQVPAVAVEPWLPPLDTLIPNIRSSNTRDWSLVDAWAWEKIAPKLTASPSIRAVLKDLPATVNDSEEARIRAVYHFMQNNIRYVFAHLGRGGYDPHAPDEVLKNGYGDCKDQAVLTAALLRALGIESYPVLIETPGSGKSDTGLVNLIFDHMLVWLPPTANRPAMWLDTTGDRALFPGVSRHLHNQPALVINGRGGLLQTAKIEHTENKGKVDLVFQLDPQRRVKVDATIDFSGVMEESIRSWWQNDASRDTNLRQYLSALFQDRSAYEVEAQVLNTENLDQPARIRASFIFKADTDDKSPPVFGASFNQIFRMFGNFSSLQAPESRQNPFVDELSYTLEMNAKFISPADSRSALVRSSEGKKTAHFELQESGRYIGKDFHVAMVYRRPPLQLSLAEYRQYYQSLLTLGDSSTWLLSLLPDQEQVAASQLEQLRKAKGTENFAYLLQVARHHMDRGEFQEALAPALRAVELDQNSGEAWYVLGMVQGFATQIEASSKSFAKAKDLGYVP